MIKIIKRNPNLKGEEFIDDQFIRSLKIAWLNLKLNHPKEIALERAHRFICDALTYVNIGDAIKGECDDCGHLWNTCKCEYCEECKNRHCMCELDTVDKTKEFIKRLAKKYNIEKEVIK